MVKSWQNHGALNRRQEKTALEKRTVGTIIDLLPLKFNSKPPSVVNLSAKNRKAVFCPATGRANLLAFTCSHLQFAPEGRKTPFCTLPPPHLIQIHIHPPRRSSYALAWLFDDRSLSMLLPEKPPPLCCHLCHTQPYQRTTKPLTIYSQSVTSSMRAISRIMAESGQNHREIIEDSQNTHKMLPIGSQSTSI